MLSYHGASLDVMWAQSCPAPSLSTRPVWRHEAAAHDQLISWVLCYARTCLCTMQLSRGGARVLSSSCAARDPASQMITVQQRLSMMGSS